LLPRVSPDVTTDQRTGQSYYTIRVSMPPEEVARLGDNKLIPGMPVEAFVQTGDRTMLSYLIKPHLCGIPSRNTCHRRSFRLAGNAPRRG
jgi:HlyD family secretion protein